MTLATFSRPSKDYSLYQDCVPTNAISLLQALKREIFNSERKRTMTAMIAKNKIKKFKTKTQKLGNGVLICLYNDIKRLFNKRQNNEMNIKKVIRFSVFFPRHARRPSLSRKIMLYVLELESC